MLGSTTLRAKRQNLITISAVAFPLILSNVSHAEVFKTVKSDGTVIYTDNIDTAYQYNKNSQNISVLDKLSSQTPTPIQSTQSNESVSTSNEISPVQSSHIESNSSATETDTLNTKKVEPSKQGDYRLTILSPQNEQSVRRGSQTIDIEVGLSPALKTGDRIVYKLNNKTLATTKNLTYSIPTTNLDPQKYTITVVVENVLGDIIARDNRDIYILSNNIVLQQKRKAAAEAQKKRDNLPWYKKIKINIY